VGKGESIPEEEMQQVGGKATWEDAPEKREANLRERKAKMVLAARQSVCVFVHISVFSDASIFCRRFLAQQQKEASASGHDVQRP
jgi:hypothetical protein